PDLRGVREWGAHIWVHDGRRGSKLAARAREGRLVGISDESKGYRVYWARTRTVTIERNVYFDDSGASEGRFEGEIVEDFEDISETPSAPKETLTDSASTPELVPAPMLTRKPRTRCLLPEPVERPRRERKPSRYIRDLTSGEGSTSARPSDPSMPVGLQVPRPSVTIEEVPDEGDEAGGVEYALAAETSEAEALDPRDLREARKRPDWPR
ncbi:hypothetical protein NEOLEDRAFT_1032506, partial [Neolentinus lepideus HHB14362 ss-1]